MKNNLKFIFYVGVMMIILGCKVQNFKSKILYQSDHLIISQISENTFLHTSFLKTNDFGNVPCNGLLVADNGELLVYDTPTNNESSRELIKWTEEVLHSKIVGVVCTHFHDDCLGGLDAFHEKNIASFANIKTILKAEENHFAIPKKGFSDSLILNVGKEKTMTKFFGEGHTKDNVVGYFPKDQVLFGGCLIKEIGANKGFLGDANTAAWSQTVAQVKKHHPKTKIVVPGHGLYGDTKLLDYTIQLFKPDQESSKPSNTGNN